MGPPAFYMEHAGTLCKETCLCDMHYTAYIHSLKRKRRTADTREIAVDGRAYLVPNAFLPPLVRRPSSILHVDVWVPTKTEPSPDEDTLPPRVLTLDVKLVRETEVRVWVKVDHAGNSGAVQDAEALRTCTRMGSF